jgi:type I restriction enzyme S subunit
MLRLPIENTSDKKGEIMAEWKNYTLEEVCERIYSGGTPSTKHEEYWNGDIKWLSSGETSQRFVYDTERKITQEGVENSSTKLATKGCTVIATAGQGYTRGQASFLMTDTYMNQSVIACKANENVILPLYLYYNLDSRYEEFRLLSDGTSTRGGLSGWILKRMEIKLPPKSSQKKIIDILYSIDRKIEENKAINNNLEQQAQAIFKSWFINFEPFNKTMPSDWIIGTIDDLAKEVVCGKTPSTKKAEYYGSNIPFITIPDMHGKTYAVTTERYLSKLGANSQVKKSLPKNSICVSCIGTAGLVTLVAEESQTNQQINSIIPKDGFSPYYIYLLMQTLSDTINKLGQSGSTIVNLNKSQFGKIQVIIPALSVMIKFDKIVSPMFEKMLQNQMENLKLTSLRDALLPRLMSGELDVSDIEI